MASLPVSPKEERLKALENVEDYRDNSKSGSAVCKEQSGSQDSIVLIEQEDSDVTSMKDEARNQSQDGCEMDRSKDCDDSSWKKKCQDHVENSNSDPKLQEPSSQELTEADCEDSNKDVVCKNISSNGNEKVEANESPLLEMSSRTVVDKKTIKTDSSNKSTDVAEEAERDSASNVDVEVKETRPVASESEDLQVTLEARGSEATDERENSSTEVNASQNTCQEESMDTGAQGRASQPSVSEGPSASEKVFTSEEMSTSEGTSSSEDSHMEVSAADKRKERMRKLHELRLRKNEARKLNHAEVVEEAKRNKRPSNWEARKRRVEWEAAEEEARKQAELEGEDYEKVKVLETSALELERRERKMMRKKNPDQGFSDFAQAQYRQYERLTKQMEPDMTDYEKKKQEMGEAFYPGVNTIIHGHKPSEAAIDRMVDDLDKQMEKKSKFSRRRGINEDADVDYINDRNMRFNQKAARFYDQYTLETKQNLERGTAV